MKSRLNFFAKELQTEDPRTDKSFGIGDDGLLAFSTPADSPLAIGMVDNPNGRIVQFTPIDHHLPAYRSNGDEESLCDGMLSVAEMAEVDFVEIKTGHTNAQIDAVKQLDNTVRIFLQNHVHTDFKTRRAIVIDKYNRFHTSKKQLKQEFYNDTSFRLYIPLNIIDIK